MLRVLILAFMTLGACAPVAIDVQTGPRPAAQPGAAPLSASQAARQFVQVAETVEPVAEAECRRYAPRLNCDFMILVDDRPGQAPNAFQTLDRNGRPILAFNLGLINAVENADELAFVMGHEAAHHVLDHLTQQRTNATVGAAVFSGLASVSGASDIYVREAGRLGANVGARTYSKDFELEADELGTIITARAGFNPVRGAQFFTRLPDPGNRFLGTHPPNAARMDVVRRTAARLQ
ncbi:M48 family metallopeptidase [Citreimonas salinaria]|uniref:Peptidase family M48 n=1 Tax=Citreimonas salinaria TaxID=321339 RepID=A0A1H3FK72_9RHOB|nr:M48 family metallopeptidase [Citreimonas salinaria]SDX91503.1 Peptidase family M48 [Citreimonas salinaria]